MVVTKIGQSHRKPLIGYGSGMLHDLKLKGFHVKKRIIDSDSTVVQTLFLPNDTYSSDAQTIIHDTRKIMQDTQTIT